MTLVPGSNQISAQSQAFAAGEANQYFERNRAKYSGESEHQTLQTLESALQVLDGAIRSGREGLRPPQSALEVGCANGLLLDRLCSRLGCEGTGIDPSVQAIRDGTQRFPSLRLQVGTAEQLPFEAESFDVVLLGFFLCLLPDSHYLLALAEANRVLRRGGFLISANFDHPNTIRRAYAHQQGLAVFRHRELDVLAATRMYSLVAKWPVGGFSFDPLQRASLSLMYKEPDAYPILQEP